MLYQISIVLSMIFSYWLGAQFGLSENMAIFAALLFPIGESVGYLRNINERLNQ